MPLITRRETLIQSGLAAAMAVPAVGAQQESGHPRPAALKVVVAGAHPDDPESGCGGTAARYADEGHQVTLLYLTRGEGGIAGKSHQEAADIRSAEAQEACRILKARAEFAGQIDGATEINAERYAQFRKLLEAQRPDVVFTHWPIDGHRDHRACSLLVFDAWLAMGRSFALYYFEVDLGGETQCFRPTHYVDITAVQERKHQACLAHQSQNPAQGFWGKYHEPMARFRGMESGHPFAEAFVHHDQSPDGRLPGGRR